MGSTQGAWGIWGRGDQLRSRSFTLFSFNIGGSLAEEAAAAAAAPHTCGRRQLLLLPRRIFLPALTSTRRLDDDTPANRMGRLNREGQRRFRRGLHRPRLRRRTPPPPPRGLPPRPARPVARRAAAARRSSPARRLGWAAVREFTRGSPAAADPCTASAGRVALSGQK